MTYAIFNKAMDKPSAEAAFSLKRTSDGAAVSGSFGWYGNALIFKPNADLAPGTQYTASISTAAKDLAGNPLAAAKSWQFTTTNPPSVTSVYPADGATGVSPSSVAYAIFNKAMDKPSAEAAFSLKRTSDGAAGERQLRLVRERADLQAQRRPGARDAIHGERLDRRQGPRRATRSPIRLPGAIRREPPARALEAAGLSEWGFTPKRTRSDLGRNLHRGKVAPCGGVCPFSSARPL